MGNAVCTDGARQSGNARMEILRPQFAQGSSGYTSIPETEGHVETPGLKLEDVTITPLPIRELSLNRSAGITQQLRNWDGKIHKMIINTNEIWLHRTPEDLKCGKYFLWDDRITNLSIQCSTASFDCRCLTSSKCEELISQFEKNGTIIRDLIVNFHMTCEPDLFFQLLKMLKVQHLEIYRPLSDKYFTDDLLNMNSLKIVNSEFAKLCSWSGDKLLIGSDSLSDSEINRFLREWKDGQRSFTSLAIYFNNGVSGHRCAGIILDGLDANPDHQRKSLIFKIPITFVRKETDQIRHYGISRSSNIDESMVVWISNEMVKVIKEQPNVIEQ